MSQSKESRFKQTMDGSDRSPSAGMLRAAASVAEPAYSTLMRMRNGLYDAKILASRHLGRPTISVGNITTGGTGKTPVVQWLAQHLSASGHRPAVLIRGYKKTSHGLSDEQAILAAAGIPVIADPDRHRGAGQALRQYPQTTIFILDDAMQHRRVRRDFELALIHAAEPFGFNRVFPRGLLREPLHGLRRADAILITHADEVDPAAIATIQSTVSRFNKSAAVFQCDHNIRADVAGKKYFAFCGIGSPASFFKKLKSLGGECLGTQAFDDHHDYTQPELIKLATTAQSAGAELLVTTAKDWVKLESFAGKLPLPMLWAELSLRFHSTDEEQLLAAIRGRLKI
jgi:tetraacyldisaccharide 4'-kinase